MARSILEFSLKLLGFRRQKPKTRLGKALRWGERCVTFVAIAYLGLLLYPELLFSHEFHAHGITIYSTQEIPQQAETLLSEINSRAARSELHRLQDRFCIFLCNSKLRYTVLAPASRHSFGITHPVNRKIVVADVDVEHNLARAFRPENNERSFVGVATHEIGHVLITRRLGLWRELRAPNWLIEGYCELLAGDSSFPEDEGDRLLAGGQIVDSPSFRYFRYRRMVEYLMEKQGLSIRQLLSGPPNEQEVEEDTRLWKSSQLQVAHDG